MVSLRKVNIGSWQTPVAKQFQLRSIPYFVITDASGKVIDKGDSRLLGKYQQLLAAQK